MLTLDVRHDPDGTTVINAVGAVDVTTAARLSAALHRELDLRPRALVLDLTEVSSLDVAGAKVMQCANDRAATTGMPIRILYRERPSTRLAPDRTVIHHVTSRQETPQAR